MSAKFMCSEETEKSTKRVTNFESREATNFGFRGVTSLSLTFELPACFRTFSVREETWNERYPSRGGKRIAEKTKSDFVR